MNKRIPIAVLISGNGSNLQAIIDNIEAGTLLAEIKLVISDQADAYGLVRAKKHHIVTQLIQACDYQDRHDFNEALKQALLSSQVEIIVLSGFMRILAPEFVEFFAGKIINIHPSLLPKFRGLNTYQRALDAGETVHGSTVHFVTAELDNGPIILQGSIDILPNETATSLKQRTQALEHQLYSAAINLLVESR